MDSTHASKAIYTARINKAIDFIEANLHNPISLEEIAVAANFSKFHFNRLFHTAVGETPFQFVSRIRLEKAASLLQSIPNSSIAEIAHRCGFTDKSIFSRNFKQLYGISASQFKKELSLKSNISQQQSNSQQQTGKPTMYFCPESQTIKWRTNMKLCKEVEVKGLPKMTLVYVRNIGPYNGDPQMFQQLRDKLFTWAAARGLMNLDSTRFLVLYHDNPTTAVSSNLRMSLCLTVPENTKVDGEIGRMVLEEAKYAVAQFELRGSEFELAWQWVYGQWLPNSGYQPDDKPYFEQYAAPPQNGIYSIELCLPVKPL